MYNEYNLFQPGLLKILQDMEILRSELDEVIVELGKVDIWYPEVGTNCIEYLRERDVYPFVDTEVENRRAFFKEHCQKIKPGRFLTKGKIYTYERGHKLAGFVAPPEIIEISGDLIKWAYNTKSNAPRTGTLSSSCMRYSNMEPFMGLYTENTRMVILIQNNQIISRALLWDNVTDIDKTSFTFMDRIYGNPISVDQLKEYAKAKGYAYKIRQSYDHHAIIFDGEERSMDKATVTLKNPYEIHRPLPYLDTFFKAHYYQNHIVKLGNESLYKGINRRTTNGGSGDEYCVACGGIILKNNGRCSYCFAPRDKEIYTTCDICGENYTMSSYGEVHASCVLKRKYLCKDCNVLHIASSDEEFKQKTCKEASWIIDGGTETKT